MKMNPYLTFKGDCEAAFKHYEQCLGATIRSLFRYEGTPMAEDAPAGWGNKIMHGSVTIGDQVLMGADDPGERYEAPRGVSISLHIKTVEEAERVFDGLSQGGNVRMPLQKTFWAERFGMLVDRFGIPWMINCEGVGAE